MSNAQHPQSDETTIDAQVPNWQICNSTISNKVVLPVLTRVARAYTCIVYGHVWMALPETLICSLRIQGTMLVHNAIALRRKRPVPSHETCNTHVVLMLHNPTIATQSVCLD